MGTTIAREYAAEQGHKLIIMASAGSNATHEAISLSQRMIESVEVDALLHVTGYYNNPPQEGIIKHYEMIANITAKMNVPIVLYNVPSRTGSRIEPETAIHLAQHSHIIGIKEAAGDLAAVEKMIKGTNPNKFTIMSGEDNIVYDIMKLGGRGVVSATANRWPREYERLCQLCAAGEWDAAKKLQDALQTCVDATFCVKNPIPIHYMFKTAVRPPLVSIEELKEPRRSEAMETIRKATSIGDFPEMDD
jgi:4-hydroxy-tetrahydrodipicolinate synthase